MRIVIRKILDISQRQKRPGETYIKLFFRVIIKGGSLLGAKLINNGILNRVSNHPRFTKFQKERSLQLGGHFYIIVVPNTLHLLNPCLKLLPDNLKIFLILNGVKKWEAKFIQKNYPNYPTFKLSTLHGSSLSHGTVLTLLLNHNEKDFGIIDHDLYIFYQKVFDELTFGPKECVIGAFQINNEKAGVIFPTTHFMFFNSQLIRGIMDKYNVDATVYRWIPSRIKPLLAELNLGYHNYLKGYATVFDTFNMIQALAFYEGFSVKFVQHAQEMWHVGGATYIKNSAYLNHIQLKFLEIPINSDLLKHYSWLIEKKEAIQKALDESYRNKTMDPKTVFAVELAIKRVAKYTKLRSE